MLYAAAGCLVLWLLGFGFGIGGGLVHLLFLAALLLLVVNQINSRRWAA